ncbi:neurotensin/neuromedin N-like [Acipenser ruthenus]|uniref:neurotensin/neuromedin N-like n=1 Tax=Acipenser ruthenus TaxID=7906 RepID=UPI002741A6BC|nr:neurotensin/neuromedin N-like [Acipenser ruthenus]
MRTQLICLVLLLLSYDGVCSDPDQEMKALEVDLLKSLYTSKLLQKTQDKDQDHLNYKNEEILKRKSPYILKRQLHINKSRRPYILKRNTFY